jgi:tRNA uridine 5-carbamoylmethylation protein Kti12
MPQLQRLKRQFIALHKQATVMEEFPPAKIADLFANFIQDNLT